MISKEKVKKILTHIILWSLYVMTFSLWLSIFFKQHSFLGYTYQTLKILPVNMFITYLTINFLLPNLNKVKNPIINLVYILLFIMISLPLQDFILRGKISSTNLFAIFLETCFIVSTATALVMSKDWLNLQIEKQVIEKEKAKAELAALKSQINPHFFFNTLNNIYSFVVRNENNKAAQVIEELSDLMSKVLYESKASRITIEKELEIIQHFIHIQEIRFEANIELKTNFDIKNREIMIPPMVLFFFVENCFKHSGSLINEKIWILLKLETQGEVVFFKAVNTIHEKISSTKEGVGISNTRKRLDLIYKSGYKLKIIKEDYKFVVELIIDTAKDAENKMFVS